IYDAETGLYYNRHRYYDADSGQYISPDPIGLAGGLRPQGYVHNPLEWVDPLGLSGCPEQRQRVLDNIEASRRSRESSNFPDPYNKELEFDSKKFDYLFGRVNSNPHNAARSGQLMGSMKKVGIDDSLQGRKILTDHFSESLKGSSNVTGVFRGRGGILQETRESLLIGPSGKATMLETTYEIMPSGARRFLTTIPKA
ncbi:RHS repeat-associated core domain-containing protein, partial [Lonsdalea quercina]